MLESHLPTLKSLTPHQRGGLASWKTSSMEQLQTRILADEAEIRTRLWMRACSFAALKLELAALTRIAFPISQEPT